MVCYHPIRCCYSKSHYAKTGKKDIKLCLHEDFDDNHNVIKNEKWLLNEKEYPHALYEYLNIPCKKCIGCRSDNASMWSMRAYHESILHKKNCFITLTYNNEAGDLLDDPLCMYSLRYRHFQLFMKKLRKEFPQEHIGYIVCGEYGHKNGRAHWHAILFNFDFPDKELVYESKGFPHYKSEILNRLWSKYIVNTKTFVPIGFCDLANVDYDCCSYVSQYVMKKLPDIVTSPIVSYDDEGIPIRLEERAPVLVKTSRNPSIGLDWFVKYGKNAVERGFCYSPSNKKFRLKVPQYYYDKFEEFYPERSKEIQENRTELLKKKAQLHPVNLEDLKSKESARFYKFKAVMNSFLDIFKN